MICSLSVCVIVRLCFFMCFCFQSGGGGRGRQERGWAAAEAEAVALCGQEVYRPWEVEIVSKNFFQQIIVKQLQLPFLISQ